MPWKIEKREDEYCVVKEADGEVEGCHPTKPEAEAQQAALYASENKEGTMTKEDSTEKMAAMGPTTFEEMDAIHEAQELRWKFGDLADEFLRLSQNILWAEDVPDKAAAISALSQEFTERLANLDQADKAIAGNPDAEADQRLAGAEPGFWRAVVQKAREMLGRNGAEDEAPFFVWKDKTSNLYWWFAIYSNNYKDNDNPPEIITAAAHQEFVKTVDAGRWPLPELWLWHVPGSRVGRAKMVAYDKENGFAVAAGTFDPGRETVAQRLMEEKGILVSHGMPSAFIERDKENPLNITRYRTREISPLPDWAAANKATGFVTLNQKETDEMLPKEKVKFLESLGLDADSLNGQLAEAAQALADAGVPSKEISAEDQETEEQETETGDEEELETEAKDTTEPDQQEETEEIAEPDLGLIVAAAVQVGVEHALEAVVPAIKSINDRLDEIEKGASDLDELSPAASFANIIRSNVVGAPETKLDGRKKEAKDAPKEAPAIAEGNTPFDVVNQIKSGQDWREVLPSDR